MANSISSVGFNDYSAEQANIDRKRQYAQALQQQGAQPLETQTAGGWAIPISPTQGLAKMLQSYAGARGQTKADEREKQLGQSYQSDLARTLMDAQQAGQGTPARTIQPDPQEAQQSADQGTPQVGAVNQPAVAGDKQAMARILMGHPATQPVAMQAMLGDLTAKPEGAFAKLHPHDYTPQSIRTFEAGGGKDFSILVPIRKKEFIDTGQGHQAVDPYSAENGSMITSSMKPGEQARLDWDKFQWANMSPAQKAHLQNESIRTGVSVSELLFNTGQKPGGGAPIPQGGQPMGGSIMGQSPQMPQGAPQQPQAVPQPIPQQPMAPRPAPVQRPPMQPQGGPAPLTGKSQQALAVDLAKQKGEMEQKREFNMGGLNSSLDEAERILKGQGQVVNGVQTNQPQPTSSLVGSGLDTAAAWVGVSPRGAAQADQLRALGGALVAKMPRMEGPQSDRDVMMYREMAGQIGDSSLPISRRLAALDTVRTLYSKYEKGQVTTGATGGWSITPVNN